MKIICIRPLMTMLRGSKLSVVVTTSCLCNDMLQHYIYNGSINLRQYRIYL